MKRRGDDAFFALMSDVDELVKTEEYQLIHNQKFAEDSYIRVNEVPDMNGGGNYAIRCIHPNLVSTVGKEFLEKIERIIPFDKWIEIIRPYYYKGEHGNKPYDLELMLRIYLLQNLYDLSDMKVMNEVINSREFSDFCGVDSPNQVPDGDTIGRFRNILVENGLQEKLFHQVIDMVCLFP